MGDFIVTVNGDPMNDHVAATRLMREADEIKLLVHRDDSSMEFDLAAAEFEVADAAIVTSGTSFTSVLSNQLELTDASCISNTGLQPSLTTPSRHRRGADNAQDSDEDQESSSEATDVPLLCHASPDSNDPKLNPDLPSSSISLGPMPTLDSCSTRCPAASGLRRRVTLSQQISDGAPLPTSSGT